MFGLLKRNRKSSLPNVQRLKYVIIPHHPKKILYVKIKVLLKVMLEMMMKKN